MAFSASDAAFEGFRLTRAHPKAIALWVVLSLVFNFAIMAIMVSLSGPALTELMQLSQAGPVTDPSVTMSLMGPIMRGYLLVLPLMLLFMSIMAGAIYRASSRPQDSAFGYVRLGAAELRLLAVFVILALLGFVVITLLSLVLGIVAGIVGVALGGAGNIAAMVLTMVVLYLSLLLAYFALYVKFAFAGPMTFLKGRIDVFGSWRATKGHFWSLCGCYLLAFILGAVVGLLGWAIAMAVMMMFGGEMSTVFQPDFSSLGAYLSPGMIAYFVIAAAFNVLTLTIFTSAPMAAYRAIHGSGQGAG